MTRWMASDVMPCFCISFSRVAQGVETFGGGVSSATLRQFAAKWLHVSALESADGGGIAALVGSFP